MDAVLVEQLFEIAAEACAFQRLGQKIPLQRLVLQVFADVGKALLAIQKGADEGVECELHLVLSACVCRHGISLVSFRDSS